MSPTARPHPRGVVAESYKYLSRADSCHELDAELRFHHVVGTALSLAVTFSFAFGIRKKTLPGRKFFNIFIIITLLFNRASSPTTSWSRVGSPTACGRES
jgi:putative aldouronate transport system permease protein